MGSLIRGTVAAGAAALALIAAPPAGAAPAWSEPQAVSPPGALEARTAIDAAGNAMVLWTVREADGSYGSGYRWWLPGRGWTQARKLPRGRFAVAVAMSAHGVAQVAAFDPPPSSPGPLAVGTAKPGEAFDDFEQVTTTAVPSTVGFGVDDVGNAILAWIAPGEPSFVHVATRRAGGRFTTPVALEDFPGASPVVAINPAGAAAVAWGSNRRGGAAVSYRPPGGSFGPPELAISEHTNPRDVAIDPAGRVVVTGDEGALGAGPESRARFAIRSPLGGWSEVRSIDAEGFGADLFVEPRGTVTFFTAAPSESRAFTLLPDGTLARETLGTGAGSPRGAMDLRGDILAAWAGPGAQVVARERSATAFEFGPARVLGTAHQPYVVAPALNDLGQAVVAWREGSPTGSEPFAPGPVRAVVRDDPALRAIPPPPDVDIYSDPLAVLDPDGDLLAPVRCSVSCKVRPTGIVFPGGGRQAVAGGGKSVRLKARRRTRVKLDFGTEGAEAARAALAAGERPWVSVTVSGRGRSPRPLVVSRRYKLRP